MRNDLTPWVRQFTAGLSEPMLTALVLAAVAAALARRPRAALVLAALACLIRPETWPFAALYGWSQWRAGRVAAWPLALGAAGVLALWLVPDQLGSSNALEGADRARAGDTGVDAALDTLLRGFQLPALGIWLAAAVCLLDPRLRGRGEIRALVFGSLTWIALVAAMALFGYAGLARFMEPAAAIVCVLGGVGAVSLATRIRAAPSPVAYAAGAAVALLLVTGMVVRIIPIDGQLQETARRSDVVDGLFALVESSGRKPLAGCRPIGITDGLNRPALAWELELPMREVVEANAVPKAGTWFVAPNETLRVFRVAEASGPLLGEDGGWRAYRIAGSACEG